MKSVAVFSLGARTEMPGNPTLETVEIDGIPVTCGLIASRNGIPDRLSAGQALVHVRAFSCSLRDKGSIHALALSARKGCYYVIGSDFCGDVLDVADPPGGIKPGDRVILNSCQESLRTCRAGREFQVLPAAQLLRVPDRLPTEQLAALGLPARMAYCMVRVCDVKPGMNVLVTGGRSAVSLAALRALQARKANAYVLTTSRSLDDRFAELGVAAVLHGDGSPHAQVVTCEEAVRSARRFGGFEAVLDPFLGAYFENLQPTLRPGAVYVSCSWGPVPLPAYSAGTAAGAPGREPSLKRALTMAITNNIELRLTSFGTSQDLEQALADFSVGLYSPTLDRVFDGNSAGAFLTRTFESKERFGRVVYRYY
jgi:NADPH:quinone reductase-like Zn-dependent oxidoreductase